MSLCVAVFRWRRWGGLEVPESAHQVPKLLDLYPKRVAGQIATPGLP